MESNLFADDDKIDMATLAGFKAGCHGLSEPPAEFVENDVLLSAWHIGNRMARTTDHKGN